jgi:hypothetical protein
VKLLLDECLDWRLRHDLPGHEVKTVQEMSWAGVKNGKLLELAQTGFDAFITADRNLSFQQNLSRFSITVFVLKSRSVRTVHLKPLMRKILQLLPRETRASHYGGNLNRAAPNSYCFAASTALKLAAFSFPEASM